MWFVYAALGVMLGSHLYVYRRAVHDVFTGRRARLIGAAVVILFGLTVLATFLLRRTLGPEEARPLHYVGYLWLALVLYASAVLLVGELARLGLRLVRRGPDPERRRFLSRMIAGGAGMLALGAVGYGAVMARRPRVERREVLLDRLDPAFDGFTIAAIADVHLGPLVDGADLAGFVRTVNAAGPDMVAVVGDLVDGGVDELRSYVEPLRALHGPTFFVTGNHEYFSDPADWVGYLPSLGVRVLRNERVEIRRGDAVLDIAGCDDRTAAASGVAGHGFDLDAALAGRDQSRPVVLLSHQPAVIDAASRAGVDLQISGHTHGGQMWPLTYVALLDQPVLAGLTRIRNTWLYVTRGVGFWGPPVRIGSPPEITLLTLRARRV